MNPLNKYSLAMLCLASLAHVQLVAQEALVFESDTDWSNALEPNANIRIENGMLVPQTETVLLRSKLQTFPAKRKLSSITVEQSPVWENWQAIENLGPTNLRDAPVFLVKGPNDYWIFGRKASSKNKGKGFSPEAVTLEGFDIPLQTTPFANQYDAPGGLVKGTGGYHAWQSRDMVNWVHHGSVTEKFSKWVTTAEMVDGKAYIYYDFPNDQDPHLYIDDDLTDGKPGTNMGLAFKDPSHGSDCAVIRSLDGKFHVIYEDWSPINAQQSSWDSPLAGRAVSNNGHTDWDIQQPAVDYRTEPTGEIAEFKHPYWTKEDPKNFASSMAKYEVHSPKQDAYGDWAAISIGGQYYLFGDYHPASSGKGGPMSTARFTAASIDEPFKFCGSIGAGHPDPDIAFAEGRFYLITQTNDFVSDGPWVESVELRIGIDTTGDGKINQWTDWQEVKERYDTIQGFSKQVDRSPASIDLSELPEAYAVCFEMRLNDTTENQSKPIIDTITIQ